MIASIDNVQINAGQLTKYILHDKKNMLFVNVMQ